MYIFLLFIFLLPIFAEESHFDLNINELQEVIITENDYGSFIKRGFKVYSTENPSKDFNLQVESKSLKEEIYKENEIPNYKFRDQYFWFLLKLKFPKNSNEKYYLVLDYPPLDEVELFRYNDSQLIDTQITGDHIDLSKKLFYNRKPVFLLSGEESHLLIRVKTVSTLQLPIIVYNMEKYNQSVLVDSVEQSMYFGALLALFVYNLFLTIITRLPFYRFYVFFLFCYGMFQASLYGYGAILLWPDAPHLWMDEALTFFISFAGIFTYLFAFSLLELKKNAPSLYKLGVRLVIIHSPHIVILWFVPHKVGTIWLFISAGFWSIYLISVSIYLSFKKFKIAQIYLLSWIVFIIGSLINLFLTLGYVPRNFITIYSQQIGSVLEFILLSLTMAYRVKLLEEAGKKSLENQVAEISKLNIELESTKERATKAYLDLEASQKQLVQSDKMITLGSMVAGVAHEINTPLGAIIANSENILESMRVLITKLNPKYNQITITDIEKSLNILEHSTDTISSLSSKETRALRKKIISILEERNYKNIEIISDYIIDLNLYETLLKEDSILNDSDIEKYLEIAVALKGIQKKSSIIKLSAERVSKIVKSLKSFMHFEEKEEKVLSDITEGMETVLIILHNKIKYGIEVIKNYNDIPKIYCYPDELNQVWTNLVHNAVQAMGDTGKLQIDIERIVNLPSSPDIDKRNPEYKGEYVSISIQDNGPGIPQEIKHKIFQAFFTTKPAGEGSGLGLHIIGKILEKHQGALFLDSVPGNTRFSVVIPTE